jgi:hypothetical protein
VLTFSGFASFHPHNIRPHILRRILAGLRSIAPFLQQHLQYTRGQDQLRGDQTRYRMEQARAAVNRHWAPAPCLHPRSGAQNVEWYLGYWQHLGRSLLIQALHHPHDTPPAAGRVLWHPDGVHWLPAHHVQQRAQAPTPTLVAQQGELEVFALRPAVTGRAVELCISSPFHSLSWWRFPAAATIQEVARNYSRYLEALLAMAATDLGPLCGWHLDVEWQARDIPHNWNLGEIIAVYGPHIYLLPARLIAQPSLLRLPLHTPTTQYLLHRGSLQTQGTFERVRGTRDHHMPVGYMVAIAPRWDLTVHPPTVQVARAVHFLHLPGTAADRLHWPNTGSRTPPLPVHRPMPWRLPPPPPRLLLEEEEAAL